jgi:hypothetical protein
MYALSMVLAAAKGSEAAGRKPIFDLAALGGIVFSSTVVGAGH